VYAISTQLCGHPSVNQILSDCEPSFDEANLITFSRCPLSSAFEVAHKQSDLSSIVLPVLVGTDQLLSKLRRSTSTASNHTKCMPFFFSTTTDFSLRILPLFCRTGNVLGLHFCWKLNYLQYFPRIILCFLTEYHLPLLQF